MKYTSYEGSSVCDVKVGVLCVWSVRRITGPLFYAQAINSERSLGQVIVSGVMTFTVMLP